MNFRKITVFLAMIALITALTGCDTNSNGQDGGNLTTNDSSKNNQNQIGSFVTTGVLNNQLDPPQKGEEIAVITVKNYGVIKCRLFEQVAPNAVNNFKKFAREGLYNGVSFHRVVENFMIQAGREADAKNKAKPSQIEINNSARHYNGALCMARSESEKEGQMTQFYIVSRNNADKADFDMIKNQIDAQYRLKGLDISVEFDKKTRDTYKKHGGCPELDMIYTVFGQVFQGQDVVDKIAHAPKKKPEELDRNEIGEQEPNSVTKDPVIIEKIEIVKA